MVYVRGCKYIHLGEHRPTTMIITKESLMNIFTIAGFATGITIMDVTDLMRQY
jgi:hypothetical protein